MVHSKQADADALGQQFKQLSINGSSNTIAKNQKPQSKSQKRKQETKNVIAFFDKHYGDGKKLEAWQTLCTDLGVEMADTITQCKKHLKPPYVNIYDFVKAQESGEPCKFFKSYEQLCAYTKKTGQFFPLKKAKQNLILSCMLVEMGKGLH
ncbi:hypothetical protein LTR62_004956 [Meristemomyces frigidus]|uniref:Uncharacterized protein n=1 Tax=Meristemomyces frigidus TaxID=1508187 RepID=A0AAN7TQX1_9PEZI|nr:hypothetical protein LTR62_004956 [Meristemomyces frigidus]